MSVARDGSIGVFGITWRRIENETGIFVHESASGEGAGVMVGPFPSATAARDHMVEAGKATKAAYITARQQSATHHGVRIHPCTLPVEDESAK